MDCPALNILISKTRQGDQDYLQITSPDQVTLNIVLIARKIKVDDIRKGCKEKK